MDDLLQCVQAGDAKKGRSAGEKFVEQRSQGVNVGGGGRRSAFGLLGGHVAGRAQNGAAFGVRGGLGVGLLGETEVSDLRNTINHR